MEGRPWALRHFLVGLGKLLSSLCPSFLINGNSPMMMTDLPGALHQRVRQEVDSPTEGTCQRARSHS